MMSDERNRDDVEFRAIFAAAPLPDGPRELGTRVVQRLRRRRAAARAVAGAAALAVVGAASWFVLAGLGGTPRNSPTLAGQLNEFAETPLAAPPPVANLDVLHQQQDAMLEELKALGQ